MPGLIKTLPPRNALNTRLDGSKRATPSPPLGERDGVRGITGKHNPLATKLSDSGKHALPSPPLGERARVRGYPGKHRTRTLKARNAARTLRRRATAAEKDLWRLLRDRRFSDFKFRRQYALGPYYLDFYCTEAKLAVELDGGGHGFPDQRARDEKRTRFLAKKGVKILRFWNHQLHGEREAIRFEIWHALMERTGRAKEIAGYLAKAAPSPRPSPPMGAREKSRPLQMLPPVASQQPLSPRPSR